MDEIADAAELRKVFDDGHARSSTRCFRCKTKRLKCRYEFPTCHNCEKEGHVCFAWIKGLNKPVPRSLALYLENRVAELEIKLAELSVNQILDRSEEQALTFSKYVAAPFIDAFEQSERDRGVVNFPFLYFRSSSLPAPFDSMLDNSERGNMKRFVEEHPPVDLYSIPADVVQILMHNYTNYHQPQYPILSRLELKQIESRVFESRGSANSYDYAAISIALAISAATLTHKGEKKSLSSSSVLFSQAIIQLTHTVWESKLKKLQITLLIAHYAFANPYAADIWYTVRECLRLCLDLGLHREVQMETSTMRDIDIRRRLFLVTTSMARHLSSVLRIAFPIPDNLISVEKPATVDDSFITEKGIDLSGPQTKAAALHFYQFRLYETEVHEVLWLNKELNIDTEEWLDEMESKVEKWYLKAEEFAKLNQLRFRLICKASLQTRLRRRSPRITNPPRPSYVKLVNSLVLLIDEYLRDSRSGQVFYLLMGVYYIEEAAVNLADVIWTQGDWILDFFTPDFLDSKLKGCIDLLLRFSERWPDITRGKMIQTLTDIYLKASKRLFAIAKNRSNIKALQKDAEVSAQIEQLLFPQNDVLAPEASLQFSENKASSVLDSGSMPGLLSISKQSSWTDNFNVDGLLNLEEYVGLQDWV
ncbi:hypothetical protein KL915_004100 [Ogataea haglerorum]|nr:hypothetical protein KL915_004100 [Ogataea haglerorum]